MPFWVAESNADGTRNTSTEAMIRPHPTKPEYGERFKYSIQETDGRGVRQRVAHQSAEMKWVWLNYRDSVPGYTTVYNLLFKLQSHIREQANVNPRVWIKEDVTGALGKWNSTTKLIDAGWVPVMVTYVGRTDPDDGGTAVYPTTEFRFVLDTTDEIY